MKVYAFLFFVTILLVTLYRSSTRSEVVIRFKECAKELLLTYGINSAEVKRQLLKHVN